MRDIKASEEITRDVMRDYPGISSERAYEIGASRYENTNYIDWSSPNDKEDEIPF